MIHDSAAGEQQEAKKVRLVHVTTVPQSLFFLAGQASYLRTRGFEVHVLSSPGALLDDFGVIENVPTIELAMRREVSPIQDLLALCRLVRILRALAPDIVHAHTPKGGLLGMVAALLSGIRVRIYNVHGLPFVSERGLKRLLLRTTEAISCALAQRVLCVSRSLQQQLLDEGLCSPKKTRVLGRGSVNGVDSQNRFNPDRYNSSDRARMRAQHGILPDALVIGFIGRLTRDKGLQELAAAWRDLESKFPDLHLLLVGPHEVTDGDTRNSIESLRESSRVHLIMGWVRRPEDYFAMIDVLAFPTHREGFGLVALEAAAMAIPVVSTRIPGCIDAVEDGVTGTLVPPRDAEALARALAEYILKPGLRERRGRAGRERAVRSFQPSHIWQKLASEYTTLLASARASRP